MAGFPSVTCSRLYKCSRKVQNTCYGAPFRTHSSGGQPGCVAGHFVPRRREACCSPFQNKSSTGASLCERTKGSPPLSHYGLQTAEDKRDGWTPAVEGRILDPSSASKHGKKKKKAFVRYAVRPKQVHLVLVTKQ